MNKTTKWLRICLTILLVISLLGTFACMTVSAMTDAKGFSRYLRNKQFYGYTEQMLAAEWEEMQSIINVDTAKLSEAIPSTATAQELQNYTESLNAKLLGGNTATYTVDFHADTLQALIDTAFSEEIYYNNTRQMEKDRADAYRDIVALVNETLQFFPQSLWDKAVDLVKTNTGLTMASVYRLIAIVRILQYVFLLLTVGSVAALYFLGKDAWTNTLRYIAGIWFISGSVIFLPIVFMRSFTLMNRLSLSDGLLRRYILGLVDYIRNCVFRTSLLIFLIGLAALAVALVFCVKYPQKTCQAEETVLE